MSNGRTRKGASRPLHRHHERMAFKLRLFAEWVVRIRVRFGVFYRHTKDRD